MCYTCCCKPESRAFSSGFGGAIYTTNQPQTSVNITIRCHLVVNDQPVADHDSMIANHIMNNRADSTPEILIEQGSEVDPSKSARHEGVDSKEGIVNRELIRKYVAFAKGQSIPDLQTRREKR